MSSNGFTAYAEFMYYNSSHVIQFPNVISNLGSSYSPDDSRYVCPVNGTYLVTLTFRKFNDDPIHAGVQKSSVFILHIEDTASGVAINHVSNSRLFQCTEDEIVSVQGTDEGAISAGRDSTFSVLLLHPDGKLFLIFLFYIELHYLKRLFSKYNGYNKPY